MNYSEIIKRKFCGFRKKYNFAIRSGGKRAVNSFPLHTDYVVGLMG